jgi:hypothetical protein
MAFERFSGSSRPEMPYPPPVGVLGRTRVAIITVIPEEFTAALCLACESMFRRHRTSCSVRPTVEIGILS